MKAAIEEVDTRTPDGIRKMIASLEEDLRLTTWLEESEQAEKYRDRVRRDLHHYEQLLEEAQSVQASP